MSLPPDELIALANANRGKEMKVFDWDKAARVIVERGIEDASAGLTEDWFWTGGSILVDGAPDENGEPYLASTWATPVMRFGDDEVECYRMESETPGWGSQTRWPQSARDILASK